MTSPNTNPGQDAAVLLQQFVDRMNESTPDDYVYTRAQLATAIERGTVSAAPLVVAGGGVATAIRR